MIIKPRSNISTMPDFHVFSLLECKKRYVRLDGKH